MAIRTMTAITGSLLLMAGGQALADTAKTPPGNPCLKNNGNPCNGNNGNIGAQGNANHEKVKIDKKPPPITIGMPPVIGRGAYISQIGDGNEASVVQTAPSAYARIDQDSGSTTTPTSAQTGTGTDYLEVAQTAGTPASPKSSSRVRGKTSPTLPRTEMATQYGAARTRSVPSTTGPGSRRTATTTTWRWTRREATISRS